MYILCLLIFLPPQRANKHWTLVSLFPILLSVAVNSQVYPVLSFFKVSLDLCLMNLVTTTWQLEDTWLTEKILYFTTNVSSSVPSIQLQNMTMGASHGNLNYDTILDMGLHVPLTNYKSPNMRGPPFPCCPRVPQVPTFVGLPIHGNTASLDYM